MKKGFTLAEILICITLLGILATIMVKNINSKDFKEKTNYSKALKVIEMVDQAAMQIRETDKTRCPMGSFMVDVLGTPEFAFYQSGTTFVTDSNVRTIFGDYLKYETTATRGYAAIDSSYTSIPSAKLPGDIWVGFKVLASSSTPVDCAAYKLPNQNGEVKDMPANGKKCWGMLLVDVNGDETPNEYGKDVFTFYFDENGLLH